MKELLLESHSRRKARVGTKWWEFLKGLEAGSKITGKEAMFICDVYGIRHSDLIFWMDVMGCVVNMEEFVVEIKEKNHMESLMRRCAEYGQD